MIGIDLVKIKRFDLLLKKPEFVKKTFTEAEEDYINKKLKKSETAAGIFACKEAFLKAVGIGILNGISLTQIEITHLKSGKPILRIETNLLKKFGIVSTDVSISHDANIAVAICNVMIE